MSNRDDETRGTPKSDMTLREDGGVFFRMRAENLSLVGPLATRTNVHVQVRLRWGLLLYCIRVTQSVVRCRKSTPRSHHFLKKSEYSPQYFPLLST